MNTKAEIKQAVSALTEGATEQKLQAILEMLRSMAVLIAGSAPEASTINDDDPGENPPPVPDP